MKIENQVKQMDDDIVSEGRQIASQWIVEAIEGETSPKEIDIKLALLQVAATHLLATLIMNRDQSQSASQEDLVKHTINNLNIECEVLSKEMAKGNLRKIELTLKVSKPHLH